MTHCRGFLRYFPWLAIIIAACVSDKLGNRSIVREGVGVDGFHIRTLTVKEVKRALGGNFEAINHHGYSVELFYQDLGTSFYYKVDSPDSVFAISFNNTFKGKTEKGFDIRRMTVADMLRIYGPAEWQLLESVQTLYAHYDSLGIYFAVRPREPTPLEIYYPDDSMDVRRINVYYDTVYHADRIIEFSIGIPGTDF